MTEVQETAQRVIENVERVMVGKHREVSLVLIAMLCRGHVLIEDVPGVGKTTLAKAIARSLGLRFRRIQCTPDMLPSDITGVSIYNQKTGEFEFRPGPVMSQIVLTDEINRATPKTQSALLEAMEERQVTVDGVTHPMERPFLVLATQNPIEYEGTFPLPEAQLDRFILRIRLGYPDSEQEVTMLDAQRVVHPLDEIEQVVDSQTFLRAQELVTEVYLNDLVKQYIVNVVGATREHEDLYLGASPRGSLALYKTAQARAALQGRDYVIPDDVKYLADPALAHRIIVSPSARIKNVDPRDVVADVLAEVPVPGAHVRAAS
ncbi:MAG: AAA family ATPase [Anaerolineae bacterium]